MSQNEHCATLCMDQHYCYYEYHLPNLPITGVVKLRL